MVGRVTGWGTGHNFVAHNFVCKVAQGLATPARQQGRLALRQGSSCPVWVCIRTPTPGGQEV